jgi:hypothetical protein
MTVRSIQALYHVPVQDAGIDKQLSTLLKAETHIERYRADLHVQEDAGMSLQNGIFQ